MPRLKGSINRKTQEAILSALVDAGRPLYVREIISKTGLRIETAIGALRSLTSKWILVKEKQGRRHYYTLGPAALTIVMPLIWARTWQPDFSAIRAVEENLKNSDKALTEMAKTTFSLMAEFERTTQVYDELAVKIDEIVCFFKQSEKEASFLTKEFGAAGINFGDLSVPTARRVLTTYIGNRKGYHHLRDSGSDVFTALGWAIEGQWNLSSWKNRDIVASEWGFSKRMPEHSEETLRQHYGFKTPKLE